MKNNKDIGDLYKARYSDLEIEPDKSVWDSIELKNEEIRFYRFVWNQFNIYYLSSIIAFSALSIFSFVNVMTFNNTNQAKINSAPVLFQNSIPQNSLSESAEKLNADFHKGNSSPVINTNKTKRKINIKSDSLNENSSKYLYEPALENMEAKDSINKLIPPIVIKKTPKRRVVIVEQRDTVVQIDTLKSKLRRKR
jgi:hypothetical protein